MKRLLVITPHLSTGGLPQVSANKIELLKDTYEIKCIEYSNIAPIFRVQKDRIIESIGDENLIILDENKHYLIDIIEDFKPDFVSMEEIPEFFMDDNITSIVYKEDRQYKIFESTHDSSFPVQHKRWFPDKFIFVSAFNAFRYSMYDIPYDIVEYPVDIKEKKSNFFKQKLGLESDWKHVVNVGLFTPRKNQQYLFEIAHRLKDYKIKFHFLGNQAGNFQDYWQPLMDNKPNNCVVWGERNDVYDFLEASDLFFFASKGDRNNKELNPIAIKEALEYQMPMMMHNLDVYCGKYDDYENITFLTGDINIDSKNLLNIFNMKELSQNVDVWYSNPDNKIFIQNNSDEAINWKVSFRDLSSNAPIYWMNWSPGPNQAWFVVPIPTFIMVFHRNSKFRGFSIEFYTQENEFLFQKEIVVNDIIHNYPKLEFSPFDCSYRNYNEFFVDDIYRDFALTDLDTVIDVGANIGLFSKYMYWKRAKNCILVEANPFVGPQINMMLGNDASRSKVYLSPLYSEKTNVNFKYSTNNSTIGSTYADSNRNEYDALDSEIDLETITISEIFEENNLDRVSLFKCDIEGGEYDLIPNIPDEYMSKIDRFMIEFHMNENDEIRPILDKLERNGFEYRIFYTTMYSCEESDDTINHGIILTK